MGFTSASFGPSCKIEVGKLVVGSELQPGIDDDWCLTEMAGVALDDTGFNACKAFPNGVVVRLPDKLSDG